jgi:anti-sigma-K factor RskA
MNYADPELRDRLAAEYALGTLRGLARRRFQRLLSSYLTLRRLVEDWELMLSPLSERIIPVEPPEHVWDEIAKRITPAPATARVERETSVLAPWLNRLWDNLSFWRAATVLAATSAALLAFLRPSTVSNQQIAALNERLARIENTTRGLVGAPGQIAALDDRLANLGRRIDVLASQPTHVAVLLDKDRRPMMAADFDSGDGRLVLRLNITPPRDFTASVLEVWLVAPDGARRSLGVFPSERPGTTTALFLPHDTAQDLAKAALAVSLEPKGGSATGQPSGPILFSGRLIRLAS